MTVRIPLDYYRILGLPIQATAEQLKQAHRDRTLQLPRREYSEIAIESRKSLIDEAYTLLSDADQREAYDAQFLARTYTPEALEGFQSEVSATNEKDFNPQMGEETLRSLASDNIPPPPPEPYTPTVEVSDNQFVGALLILLELGEYELVIRLGRPFMTNGDASLADGRYGDPDRVQADIVLSLALACLELGREQWQQNQYENAAESLETGLAVLLQADNFPSLRAELQSDLYKLRPYRVLELVARPLDQTAARRQGLKLLKAMLQDRSGIDGTGDDLSGLSTDDFLRFIQQLRGYLTAAEQQEIFEAEARRPSAVATYLAVYALLARGFSFHQPALIRRAKQLLQHVGTRQDVHLEQAVCALLLGQAEEAGHALERSQEYEPLAFIREHSQGSPDLLPGLCLYAERWLREEVFTHFRDLADRQTALKEYFADAQVQSFLETMPLASTTSTAGYAAPTVAQSSPAPASEVLNRPSSVGLAGSDRPGPPAPNMASANAQTPHQASLVDEQWVASQGHESHAAADTELSIAERVSQLSPTGHLRGTDDNSGAADTARNGHRPSPAVVSPPTAATVPNPSRPSRSPHWGRLAGVVVIGLLAMGTLGFVTVRTISWIGAMLSGPKIQRPALDIGLTSPPVSIPTPPAPEAQISISDIAERTITDWLSAKREAMGPEHSTERLAATLVDPALTEWQNLANGGQRDNWYYEYEHSVNVLSVEPDDPTAEELTVEAQVQEVASFYELGTRNDTLSYDADLTMRYELVRQDGNWYVRDMAEAE